MTLDLAAQEGAQVHHPLALSSGSLVLSRIPSCALQPRPPQKRSCTPTVAVCVGSDSCGSVCGFRQLWLIWMVLEGLCRVGHQEKKWPGAANGYGRARGLFFYSPETPVGQHTAQSSTLLMQALTACQDEHEPGLDLQKPSMEVKRIHRQTVKQSLNLIL